MTLYWYVIGGVVVAGIIALIPALYVTNKVAPFAYPNARLRAMRARQVTKETLLELADRPYNDIIYYLEKNHYPTLSEHTGADRSFANVDAALRSNLVETLEQIKRISPQQTKPFIKALLAKYDITVIESVTRSLAAHTNITSDILHKSTVFSNEFITKDNHSLEDLHNELKQTPYQDVFETYLEDIRNNSFANFEEALDLLYFSRLRSRATSQEARGYVKRLIDSHNIALVHKQKDPLISGGKIPLAAYQETTDTKKLLQEHGYTITATSPETIERDMQSAIKQYAKQLLAKDPLSEASIIGFVALLAVRTRSTSILLKMKHHELSAQHIREVIA